MNPLLDIARQGLSLIDPETAHHLTITALKSGILSATTAPPGNLKINVCGLDFPSPLGIAAGFDKNAEVPEKMMALGFGFAEVGTVTPIAQTGNPKPRLFRLAEDEAVINRLGFNNDGHAAALSRLEDRSGTGIIGVNIGANKDSADRIEDYVIGLRAFHAVADYLTVNVSSPNTPGLRNLQAIGDLDQLIVRLQETAQDLGKVPPVFIKLAPDLTEDDLADIAGLALRRGVDGLIISNTTIGRPDLKSPHAAEAGGLSGKPLFERSTIALAKIHHLTNGKLPLIGVGGITSGEGAWQKIRAGASLLQAYTGFVFRGPALVHEIYDTLENRLKDGGFETLQAAVGSGVKDWREKEIEL